MAASAFIECFRLDISHFNLNMQGKSNVKKIAHLSDLHIVGEKKRHKRIVSALLSERPDYIVITGDILSRKSINTKAYEKFISQVSRIAPIYCSYGNHENDLSEELIRRFTEINEKYGINLLNNRTVELTNDINLCGLTVPNNCYLNPDGGYKIHKLTLNELNGLIGKKSSRTVLLAHNPLFFPIYEQWGAELVLSGHIHGGIIRIPFLCGLLSPERRFFPKYSSGLYKIKSSQMIVSRGLSKFRIFNPMQINIITIGCDTV